MGGQATDALVHARQRRAIAHGGRPGRCSSIENLDVHYGRAHALQEVSLTLERGVRAVVGRNGMGKTTLCNAITGLCPRAAASASSARRSSACRRTRSPRAASATCRRAVACGRRCRSTSTCASPRAASRGAVDAAARLPDVPAPRRAQAQRRRAAFRRRAADARDRARAAVQSAPARHGRADRRAGAGHRRAGRDDADARSPREGEIGVLLIEQNLGVAIDVADTVDVMVNGRIARSMPARRARGRPRAAAAAARRARRPGGRSADAAVAARADRTTAPRIYTRAARRVDRRRRCRRALRPRRRRAATVRGYTRWNAADAHARAARPLRRASARRRRRRRRRSTTPPTRLADTGRDARVVEFPVAASIATRRVRRGHVRHQGPRAPVPQELPRQARRAHGDRRPLDVGQAVAGDGASARSRAPPSEGRARGVHRRPRLVGRGDGRRVRALRRARGAISAASSPPAARAARRSRPRRCARLPIGVPKVMVSTVASGDVKPYVGPADICMMYSVTDIAGINRISEKVLVERRARAGRHDRVRRARPTRRATRGPRSA